MAHRKRIAAQFCGGYILEDGTVVVYQDSETEDSNIVVKEQCNSTATTIKNTRSDSASDLVESAKGDTLEKPT